MCQTYRRKNLSLDNELTVFLIFLKQKEKVIKSHAIIKGAVLACELNDKSDKFCNNWTNFLNIGKTVEKLTNTHLPKNTKNWLNVKNLMFYVRILD